MPKREKSGTRKVIDQVAQRMGCFKKDAAELLDHFAAVLAETLAAEGRVEYRPLGIWKISARGAVRWKPSKRFAARIRELKVRSVQTQ